MFDEDLPQNKSEITLPRNLENLSVEELAEYIDVLRGEITRAEADIEKKNASKAAADSVFKT